MYQMLYGYLPPISQHETVLLRRHTRQSKHEPLADKLKLIETNPQYVRIFYPDGRQGTVCKRSGPNGIRNRSCNCTRKITCDTRSRYTKWWFHWQHSLVPLKGLRRAFESRILIARALKKYYWKRQYFETRYYYIIIRLLSVWLLCVDVYQISNDIFMYINATCLLLQIQTQFCTTSLLNFISRYNFIFLGHSVTFSSSWPTFHFTDIFSFTFIIVFFNTNYVNVTM